MVRQSEQVNHQTICAPTSCTPVKPVYAIPDIVEDVRDGLLCEPRSVPPKYFYDERGSRLFERICTTPEYYPTRTEKELLSHYSEDIIRQVKPVEIMELGSGSAKKTRHLFDACESHNHVCSYAPFDVCEPMLENVSEQLQSDYDWLNVKPLLGDYHGGLKHLPCSPGTRLYVFLGSTIGNFYPHQAQDFLREIKTTMRPGDYLLIGADRIKDDQLLNAAYNDSQGITAAFNLNILNVLNRELRADFDVDNFRHKAAFEPLRKRVEMHIVSVCEHTVNLQQLEESLHFQAGDSILTEVSP